MAQTYDNAKIITLLESTLKPGLRKDAEDELLKIRCMPGFGTTLLQLIMSEQVEMPTRQAGAIYLKNTVNSFWERNAASKSPTPAVEASQQQQQQQQQADSLCEPDKQTIRDNLIEAVIHSPDPIRNQLVICVRHVAQSDFPDKWPGIVEKVHHYIQTSDANQWFGALLAFFQLCKVYEFKSAKERQPYHKVMRIMLPLFLERLCQLNPVQTDLSVLTQKQILKIFFTFIQFMLPPDVLDKHSMSSWIEICNAILAQPVPDSVEQIDKDERPELSWWKIKKWAIRILNRIFDRYGTPSTVSKEYTEFANYFIKAYSTSFITTVLKILEQYRNGVYISPRVLQQAIITIDYAVTPLYTWKFLKPHMLVIIQEILFPLMCHTDEDDELFENDPVEYIKLKYDIFEDFVSPVNAARQLVYQVTAQRKQMLEQAMIFCMQVLQNQQLEARQKDGILHIVGAVAPILLKKNVYKDQVEAMLITYVFPEFQSPHGFLRARACWVLKSFSKVKFKSEQNLVSACNYLTQCILNDTCLPVNVEACVALNELINDEDAALNLSVKDVIGTHLRQIMLKILELIRHTENDDVSGVLQRLIYIYEDEVSNFAADMLKHLSETFMSLVQWCQEQDGESELLDDKTITGVGILSTMETVLSVMEGKLEVMGELEKVVVPVISVIIQHGIVDFYEELFSILTTLTAKQISDAMWQALFLIHDVFLSQAAADYFTEMMPVLHNYVTVDTPAFLADNNKRLECVFKIIKEVLTCDSTEYDCESQAAKLLEVIVLQCHGQIDSYLPLILQFVFQRLSQEDPKEPMYYELKVMLFQVVVAAIWCNTDVVLQTLDQATLAQNTGRSVLLEFIDKWMAELENVRGVHDRKVGVLGLCTLMQVASKRPHDVAQISNRLLPAVCMLLESLEKAYAERAQEEADDDESDGEYESDDEPIAEGEEDDEEEKKGGKMNGIEDNESKGTSKKPDGTDEEEFSDDEDDVDSDDSDYETALDGYTTCIDSNDDVDEFIIFRDTLQALETNDADFYRAVTTALTPEQVTTIQNFITTANNRQAQKESKKILASGGYNFPSLEVPQSFNFGTQNANSSFNSPQL